MPDKTIRVFLIDDHRLVLESLVARLKPVTDMEVSGGASCGDTAIRDVVELQPDVVVLDVEMHGRGAFDLALEIRNRCPDTRILFLTGFESDVLVEQALRVGGNGYILKGDPIQTLIEGIRTVARGEYYFSDVVRKRLHFDESRQQFCLNQENPLSGLTPRQIEVLRHLARGDSVKEVAKMMHLSQKSVDSHKYRIMHKLGIHDRVQLARFAIREGLAMP